MGERNADRGKQQARNRGAIFEQYNEARGILAGMDLLEDAPRFGVSLTVFAKPPLREWKGAPSADVHLAKLLGTRPAQRLRILEILTWIGSPESAAVLRSAIATIAQESRSPGEFVDQRTRAVARVPSFSSYCCSRPYLQRNVPRDARSRLIFCVTVLAPVRGDPFIYFQF